MLALLFVTPAFCDDDCVTIPEDAGYAYAGSIYCCNLLESRLPDGAHNAKYGDVIPWDQYYGTVLKCLGGTLHDDKWSKPFVSVKEGEIKISDLVAKHKLAKYQKFDTYAWDLPTTIVKNAHLNNEGIIFTNMGKKPWNNEYMVCDYNDEQMAYLHERFPNTTFDEVGDFFWFHQESKDDINIVTLAFCSWHGVSDIDVCSDKIYTKDDICSFFPDGECPGGWWRKAKYALEGKYQLNYEYGRYGCYDVRTQKTDDAATEGRAGPRFSGPRLRPARRPRRSGCRPPPPACRDDYPP